MRDFTEQELRKAAVREGEQRCGRIFDGLRDHAVALLDTRGHVLSWSSGAEYILGYAAHEVLGRCYSVFYTPEDQGAGKPEHALLAAREQGRFEGSGWRLRKDGSRFFADERINFLPADAAEQAAFVLISRDITEHRAGEQRLQLAVRSVEDAAICVLDTRGNVTVWNSGAERIHGYSAGEVAGRHVGMFYPPDARERGWPQQELEVAAGQGRYEDQDWRLRKDGSRFLANVIITALRDEDDTFLGYSVITRDLTQGREAEETLRSVVNNIVDGVITIDDQGTVKSYNVAAERIFGYAAEEVIGRNIKMLLPEPYHSEPDDEIERHLRSAETQVGSIGREATGRRKDGTLFPLDFAIGTFRVGDRRYFTGIVRDITERKRAQKESREAEERMRSVVNNVIDGIITIDEHGCLQSFNPAAERIFGYTAEEAIGQNVKMLMPEPYRREHDTYIANYLRTGEAKVIGIGREVVGRGKDGTVFPLDLAMGAFHLDGRRYFTGIVRDITDRKQLEQELRDRLDELAQADRHKNEFLAMLAHELRNPLAPIRNALHILKMPGTTPPAMQQARSMMERQVEQMVRLVDDLLDVSRIMQGKIDLRMEQVDLVTVVHHAIETAQPVIDAHGHKLVVSLPREPVPIQVDLFRLAQVISNLLTNAAKYTATAGSIWLSAEREGGEVAIRVKDEGIGITPELLPRVFDLFVQADRSLAHTQGGLGVGLTLVKKLVELHGGKVEAHSAGSGKGSEFVVRLAAVRDEAAGNVDTRSSPQSTTPENHRRILVVDDNVDAAESAAMLLRMWGHEARTVHDGRSVLNAAREFKPHIIFLDIGLPGMTGYEVARELQVHHDLHDVMLAAMTGYGQYDDQLQSRQAGFQIHLTKPLDPEVMKAFADDPHAFLKER